MTYRIEIDLAKRPRTKVALAQTIQRVARTVEAKLNYFEPVGLTDHIFDAEGNAIIGTWRIVRGEAA